MIQLNQSIVSRTKIGVRTNFPHLISMLWINAMMMISSRFIKKEIVNQNNFINLKEPHVQQSLSLASRGGGVPYQ